MRRGDHSPPMARAAEEREEGHSRKPGGFPSYVQNTGANTIALIRYERQLSPQGLNRSRGRRPSGSAREVDWMSG
jgi:hypothetical protein